ncbi:MAG: hypothetical protein J0H76_03050 [Sphingobacteriales bacterium]|nr:hypothetical protein [Sphingobacteriales bacterium]
MYPFIIKIRSALLVYLTHKMALPLLKIIRKPVVFPYSYEDLQSFPNDTLGKDLYFFLWHKKLDLLPYYAKHDVKHILLGYDTTDDGEVCLQCFMLGNGHLSFPVLATVCYGFVTMPEHWALFKKAWQRGRRANDIRKWEWVSILPLFTHDLKNKIDRL